VRKSKKSKVESQKPAKIFLAIQQGGKERKTVNSTQQHLPSYEIQKSKEESQKETPVTTCLKSFS
jgi:hypothetical protein